MPASLPDRISRIVALHNTLLVAWSEAGDSPRIADILEAMGCERKTLYKCAEELRRMGAPIEYDRKRFTWRYTDAWSFPLQVVEPVTGAFGIRLAMDFLLDPELKDGLKYRLALDPMLRTPGNTTLARLTGIFPKMYLGRLSLAIRERRLVRFDYRKPGESTSSTRIVEPVDLFEWNGMPYLQAREPAKHPERIKRFTLSRMHELDVLPDRFKRTPKKQIPSCLGAFSGDVFDAVFLADRAHAPYVRERKWHPSQRTRELPDGSVEFALPFGDPGEASRWILGHGPGFKPIAPPELVAAWKQTIQEFSATASISSPPRWPTRPHPAEIGISLDQGLSTPPPFPTPSRLVRRRK